MKVMALGTTESAQLRKQLKKIEFFSALASVDLGALANKTKLMVFGEGETIFKQGDAPNALYLILDGHVAVQYKTGFFKRAKDLEELGAGHFFGEMALLDSTKRTATVKTLAPTKLFVVDRHVIDDVLSENEKFRKHIHAVAETRKFINGRHT